MSDHTRGDTWPPSGDASTRQQNGRSSAADGACTARQYAQHDRRARSRVCGGRPDGAAATRRRSAVDVLEHAVNSNICVAGDGNSPETCL